LLLAIGPVGPAFRVNADTGNRVSATDVAADAAGEFVVVWDAVSDDEATASAVSS